MTGTPEYGVLPQVKISHTVTPNDHYTQNTAINYKLKQLQCLYSPHQWPQCRHHSQCSLEPSTLWGPSHHFQSHSFFYGSSWCLTYPPSVQNQPLLSPHSCQSWKSIMNEFPSLLGVSSSHAVPGCKVAVNKLLLIKILHSL